MQHDTGMSMWLTLALIIVAWPIAFLALWFGIISLLSLLGGWRSLASRYRATERPTGSRAIASVNGMVGWVSYNRVVTVTPNERGMFVEISWIFRIAHPTLFIPWNDVRNARKGSSFFWRSIVFDVGNPRLATMRLPADVFTGTPVFIN